MSDIIASIKENVFKLYPAELLLPALDIEEPQLDFIIDLVADRILIYTNREQLVAQYELDLVDPTVLAVDYEVPIPSVLQRIAAQAVVMAAKTIVNNNTADTGTIKSIEDNGQKISYGDQLQSFFTTSDDVSVFSGLTEMLINFRIPTIADSTKFQNQYCEGILR